MINHASTTALAQIALRSVEQSRKQQDSIAIDCIPSFECKLWRSNGFSDTTIYRLSDDSGSYAIRSWPNRFDTPSKIAFWSGVNDSFASLEENLVAAGGCNPMPFPCIYKWYPPGVPVAALLPFNDQLWTLCDWVQGKPIPVGKSDVGNADKTLVHQLATVLGRLHKQSVVAMDRRNECECLQVMQSNSIRERLESMQSVDMRLFAAVDNASVFSSDNLSDKVKHCLAIILERKLDWQRFLSICASQLRSCHWIVRDLWRENVLVDDSMRFSSIVDLGAARFDWPGLDFIRLFGSLNYGTGQHEMDAHSDLSNDLWQDAYSAYTNEHPRHAIDSLDECRMLHCVSIGLSIVQWTIWINQRIMDFSNAGKAERVKVRVSELCDQFLLEST